MKKQNTQNANTKLSLTTEIKKLFDNGLTTEQIKTELDKKGIVRDKHFIRNVTYRLRVRDGLIKPQSEPTTNETTQEKTITINVFENDYNDLILFVKTNKDFEEWLRNNKELRTTTNLWGLSESGDYYHLSLDANSNLDDINSSIFRGYNKIALNRAILRIKGISEGLTFNLGNHGLITEDSLRVCIKSFIKLYGEFYNKNILNKKININAMGVLE